MKDTIYEFIEKTNIKDSSGHYLNKYKCKICGKEKLERPSYAKNIKKCIHLNKNHIKINNELKNERLYRIYVAMINRCNNKNSKDYKRYGKRNIKVCDEWSNNYYVFQNWAINNGYQDSLTIDRINNDGNYEPNNCRWITKEENTRFKSTTNIITINGIKKSGTQWALYIGKGRNYINCILRKYGYDYTVNYIKEHAGLV